MLTHKLERAVHGGQHCPNVPAHARTDTQWVRFKLSSALFSAQIRPFVSQNRSPPVLVRFLVFSGAEYPENLKSSTHKTTNTPPRIFSLHLYFPSLRLLASISPLGASFVSWQSLFPCFIALVLFYSFFPTQTQSCQLFIPRSTQ